MKSYRSYPPLVRVSVKFGLVGSFLSITIMLLLFYTGRHPSLIPPYLDSRILVFLVFIYFGIREFKEYHNNKYLHFWQGMLIGIMTYLTVGVLGAIFVYIFSSIETSFITEYISTAKEGMMEAKEVLINGPQGVKMSEEEFQRHLSSLEETTSGILAVDYFIKSCIVGFFIPLFYSVIFRKVEKVLPN